MMPDYYEENPDINWAPESTDEDEDSGEPQFEEEEE
jgi:hypothetical protein